MDPNWITITEANLFDKDVAPRIQAARTAALAQGQEDPLPALISEVVGLVRGYVAGRYRVGPVGTIPARLQGPAADIATYRLLARIGRASSEWSTRNREAMTMLRDVQRGNFHLVDPAEAAPEEPGGPGRPTISNHRRQSNHHRLDGI